ncbi:protein tyrosine phosphatase [Cotesia plutellae polydnavirus]|nr:protein tyrosine phosphatase [Cotesia plutellae polydnavirus]
MNTNLSATYGPAEFLKRFHSPDFVNEIIREHASILSVPITGSCENFKKPANKNRNRSQQYPCWDISRVVLFQINGTDYINANYVSGFDQPKKFIATEHPMEHTLNDFWTMVWQEYTLVIVMLSSAEEESQPSNIRYFPYNQDETLFSDFVVKEDKIVTQPSYTETVLNIINRRTGELRTVYHFKHLDWPEDKSPDVPKFFDFLLAVNEEYQEFVHEALITNRQFPGPIVVHGSKGIGRTSTFCAADSCLYQLVSTATISVPSIVLRVRQQRNFSITSVRQYIFIHMLLHCYLKKCQSNLAIFYKFRSHLTAKDIHLLI